MGHGTGGWVDRLGWGMSGKMGFGMGEDEDGYEEEG